MRASTIRFKFRRDAVLAPAQLHPDAQMGINVSSAIVSVSRVPKVTHRSSRPVHSALGASAAAVGASAGLSAGASD